MVAAALILAVSMTPAPHAGASFPGANGKIVFSSTRVAPVQIFNMNSDGTNPLGLTNTASSSYHPRYNATGTKIVFVRNSDIWKANADGSSAKVVRATSGLDGAPAFSPDGRKIAFDCTKTAVSGICLMTSKGEHVQWLVKSSTDVNGEPVFSPNGKRIAFYRNTEDANSGIYSMRPDGTHVNQLTSNAEGDYDPDWSPDGSQLIFSRVSGADNLLFMMNANGTNETQYSPGGVKDYDPAWSPDGTMIAFVRGAFPYQIYVEPAAGGAAVPITALGSNLDPDWQPV